MKPKQALVLLAVVAAVIVGIIIFKFAVQPRLEQKTQASGVMFPELDPARVDRLEVSAGDSVAAIVRQGDSVWAVESAGNYTADADAVERALDAVKGLRKDLPASENKENHARLGVDDRGVRVKLLVGQTAVAELVIGSAGKSYGTAYARPAGSDTVYLVSQDLRAVFPAGSSAWRDKAIFNLELEDINEIRLWSDPKADATAPAAATGSTASPATPPPPAITPATPGALVIKKGTGGEWEAIKDGNTAEKLDTTKVDALARALATLTAVEFADTVTPGQAGLDSPARRAEFVTADGKTLTLLVGGQGGMDIYVQRGDRPVVYKVYPYNVDNIFKTIEELRPLPGGADAGSMLPPPNMPGMGGPGAMPTLPEIAPPATTGTAPPAPEPARPSAGATVPPPQP